MHNEHRKTDTLPLAQVELALACPNKKFAWQFLFKSQTDFYAPAIVGIYVLSIEVPLALCFLLPEAQHFRRINIYIIYTVNSNYSRLKSMCQHIYKKIQVCDFSQENHQKSMLPCVLNPLQVCLVSYWS